MEKSGLKNPPFSLWFPLAWVGWGPKLPKFIGRTPPNHQKFWRPCPWEFSGSKSIGTTTCWLENPSTKGNHMKIWGFSTQIFPRALFMDIGGKQGPKFFFQGSLGRAQWKIWIEPPPPRQFPYGFLWPGCLRPTIPKIHWEDPPQTTQNFGEPALGIFRVKIHWDNSMLA